MPDSARTLAYLKRNPGVNLRRYELLTVLVDFVKSAPSEDGDPDPTRLGTKGATPSELGWWKLFNNRAPSYGFMRMAYSTFLVHVRKLIDEGYISKKFGLICIEKASWQAPTDLPMVKRSPRPLRALSS